MATEFKAKPIEEEKLRRIKRLSQVGAVLSLLVFIVLFGYSIHKLQAINAEIDESGGKLAKMQKDLKDKEDQLTLKNDELKLKTDEFNARRIAVEELTTRYEKLNDLVAEIEKANPAVVASAEKVTDEKNAQENPGARKARPLVFLHIADESQRKRATEIGKKLQAQGYVVPGVENVRERAPKMGTQLRFFRRNDEGAADINGIMAVLKGENIEAQPVTLSLKYAGSATARQYEIWFGADLKP